MSNVIKRESLVNFSFTDNTIIGATPLEVSFNKAGLPLTSDMGLVNVIQEINDLTVMNSEYGKTKSKFVDFGLYTAKEISRVGATVSAVRLASGDEAYKTIDVYTDLVTREIVYGIPRFKNVVPTANYIEGENVFSDSISDYGFDVIQDPISMDNDINYKDNDLEVVAKTATTADLKHKFRYLFTLQTFKPTNFIDFEVLVRTLDFDEVEYIVGETKASQSLIKSKFIKIIVMNSNGTAIEEFVCTIDDEISTSFDNKYAIQDVINLKSSYIYVTKKRYSTGNMNFSNIIMNNVKFNNDTVTSNRYVANFKEDGTFVGSYSAEDYMTESIEVKVGEDSSLDMFKGDKEATYFECKYPAKCEEVNINVESVGVFDYIEEGDKPKFKLVTLPTNDTNTEFSDFIQVGGDIPLPAAITECSVKPGYKIKPLVGDFSVMFNNLPEAPSANFPSDYLYVDVYISSKGVVYDNIEVAIPYSKDAVAASDDVAAVAAVIGYDPAILSNGIIIPSDSITTSLPLVFDVTLINHTWKQQHVFKNCAIVDGSDWRLPTQTDKLSDNSETAIDASIINIVNTNIDTTITNNKMDIDLEDTSNELYGSTTDTFNVNFMNKTNDVTFKIEDTNLKYVPIGSLNANGVFAVDVDLFSDITSSTTNDMFKIDTTVEVESLYHNNVVATKSFKYNTTSDDYSIAIKGLYTTDKYGYFEIPTATFKTQYNDATIEYDGTASFVFKRYSGDTTQPANVNAYNATKLNGLLSGDPLIHGGTLDCSIYELFYGDSNVLLNTLVDMVAKDNDINRSLQAALVSVVKKRQTICGMLSSKNFTAQDEKVVYNEWVTKGTKDSNLLLRYNNFNEMSIEVLGPWTKAQLDDKSYVSVPVLGYYMGSRLNELEKSPVLNIWGVVTGKEISYTPNVETKGDKLGFYKTLRVNTPYQISNYGKYLFGDYNTYNEESKLNKVKNFQILVYLMNNYYPILMSYIKKPTMTIEDSTNNIQNIISDLFKVTTNVGAGLAEVPKISLKSTINDLRAGLIKLTVSLVFSDTIEAIDVTFEANATGEVTYAIVNS